MADDMNAQSIRSVQFREKVRGYHPVDVDAFVAAVAETVERLERRVVEAESRLAEVESRSSATAEAEDSLRRTLVLAQRTADLAIQEAREAAAQMTAEAAAERERARQEIQELRARGAHEAQEEIRASRAQLEAQRAALLADVEALEAHLARERERLRIYFHDQLRRVEEGEPGVGAAPPMQAEVAPAEAQPSPAGEPITDTDTATATEVPSGTGRDGDRDAPPSGDGDAHDAGGADFAASPVAPDGTEDAERAGGAAEASGDDDPFLAELRRAVNDEQPLGPRDDVDDEPLEGEDGDDRFDRFVKGDDDDGRFGSRLRRRR